MSASEKQGIRPNEGSKLRQRAKTRRERFLETDVTKDERNQIMDYCLKNKISVSQFLSDLILQDAESAKSRKGTVHIQPDLELSPEDHQKLELLVHVHKKKSIGDLIMWILQPHLDVQRIHISSDTRKLRFYLSDREHETVTRHLSSRGIPARKYISFLALKAIAKGKSRK